MTHPNYRSLHESGQLQGRIDRVRRILTSCTLCPRLCGVDLTVGNLGICKTGASVLVADFAPHFGEEMPLVGQRGSGTIFFCPLQPALPLLPELQKELISNHLNAVTSRTDS